MTKKQIQTLDVQSLFPTEHKHKLPNDVFTGTEQNSSLVRCLKTHIDKYDRG